MQTRQLSLNFMLAQLVDVLWNLFLRHRRHWLLYVLSAVDY